MTTSTLNITKALTDDGWSIQATLTSTVLPIEIWVYENTGTTTLGSWYSVISPLDLPRIQIWTGAAIAVFGNKFVRHSVGNILLTGTENVDDVISRLKASVQAFSTLFKANQTSTSTTTIT